MLASLWKKIKKKKTTSLYFVAILSCLRTNQTNIGEMLFDPHSHILTNASPFQVQHNDLMQSGRKDPYYWKEIA